MRVKPQVVVWYKVFCGAMAVSYLLLIFFGIFLVIEGAHDEETFINGIMFCLMGPPFAIAFGLAKGKARKADLRNRKDWRSRKSLIAQRLQRGSEFSQVNSFHR